MVFWILVGLVIAVAIGIGVWNWKEWDFEEGFTYFFVSLLIGSAVGALLLIPLGMIFPGEYKQGDVTDQKLVALKTSSAVEGSFFLGSGTVDGERVFNYILQEPDGAYTVNSMEADGVKIYTSEGSPILRTSERIHVNPTMFPWDGFHFYDYTFHIPEGSILSDYTITND